MDCGTVISISFLAALSIGTRAHLPDEHLSAQAKVTASRNSYIGYTHEDLLRAAEGVLSAIGPSKFMAENGTTALGQTGKPNARDCLLVAQPQNRVYKWAKVYWNVCLTDDENGRTMMQVSATEQQSDGLLPQYLPSFKRDIPIVPDGGLTIAEANLFFERVDLRLQGKTKAWMSCSSKADPHPSQPVGRFICRGGHIGSAK